MLSRVLASIFALLFAGHTLPLQAQELSQTVLIGFAGPADVPRAQSMRDATQFAIDRVNQQGLRINGKNIKLKLFIVDDKNDSNLAMLGAQAAVAAGVVGMVGHYTTDASVATAKIYSEASIPQMSPSAAGREFSLLGYPTIFQMLGHSDYTAQYLAEIATKLLRAKRVMLIDNDTILGKALAKSFTAAITRQGGTIVDTDRLNPKSSDFNATMTKIKNADADLVFFAGVAPQSSAFALRLQQLGLHTKLLLAGGAINAEFPLKTDKYADGTLVLVNGYPVERPQDFKKLEKTYKEKYQSTLVPQSWFAYDAVGMLVEAMRRTDSLNPHLLVPVLRKMKYNGLSGPVSFNVDGSVENPKYTLYRAEQGSWKTLNSLP